MKNIIKKSITTIIIMALALTLTMPVIAQAKAKTKIKINKTKVTLTITKKKTKPTVQLKVKGTSKKVKWTTSNKNVSVSKKGKVTAKKKGTAVVKAKVNGKTLRCRVTVKDSRKPVNKPTNKPEPPKECQHVWVKKEKIVGWKIGCSCGEIFDNIEQWSAHNLQIKLNGEQGHSFSESNIYETYYECSKCGVRK